MWVRWMVVTGHARERPREMMPIEALPKLIEERGK